MDMDVEMSRCLVVLSLFVLFTFVSKVVRPLSELLFCFTFLPTPLTAAQSEVVSHCMYLFHIISSHRLLHYHTTTTHSDSPRGIIVVVLQVGKSQALRKKPAACEKEKMRCGWPFLSTYCSIVLN
jgi:hypothetical protein